MTPRADDRYSNRKAPKLRSILKAAPGNVVSNRDSFWPGVQTLNHLFLESASNMNRAAQYHYMLVRNGKVGDKAKKDRYGIVKLEARYPDEENGEDSCHSLEFPFITDFPVVSTKAPGLTPLPTPSEIAAAALAGSPFGIMLGHLLCTEHVEKVFGLSYKEAAKIMAPFVINKHYSFGPLLVIESIPCDRANLFPLVERTLTQDIIRESATTTFYGVRLYYDGESQMMDEKDGFEHKNIHLLNRFSEIIETINTRMETQEDILQALEKGLPDDLSLYKNNYLLENAVRLGIAYARAQYRVEALRIFFGLNGMVHENQRVGIMDAIMGDHMGLRTVKGLFASILTEARANQ